MGIPEGYVFIPKAEGVAAGLLNAADRIKADRKMGVRTTHGGYYAYEDIAREYGAGFPAAEEAPEAEGDQPEVEEEEAVAVPDESWKVSEIDDYAKQSGIDLSGAKNKAEKLALINKTADTAEE